MRQYHRVVFNPKIGFSAKSGKLPRFFANREASIELKKVYNQSDGRLAQPHWEFDSSRMVGEARLHGSACSFR
jgi:hypothetical protein